MIPVIWALSMKQNTLHNYVTEIKKLYITQWALSEWKPLGTTTIKPLILLHFLFCRVSLLRSKTLHNYILHRIPRRGRGHKLSGKGTNKI